MYRVITPGLFGTMTPYDFTVGLFNFDVQRI